MEHLIIRTCRIAIIMLGCFVSSFSQEGVSTVVLFPHIEQVNIPERFVKSQQGTVSSSYSNFQVSSDPSRNLQAEVSVVVCPKDSNRLVATWVDYRINNNAHIGYGYSTDGGLSWVDTTLATGEGGYLYQGDPSIAADSNGNFYIAFISFNNFSTVGGIWVAKSTDQGVTFPVALMKRLDVEESFDDKPYIAISKAKDSTMNNIYVAWNNYSANEIRFARSKDAGNSFDSPLTISDAHPLLQLAAMPVVGPNGTVYVVWFAKDKNIYLDKSLDGGHTFGSDVVIAQVTHYGTSNINLISGSRTIYSFPIVAVNPVSGSLHVVWNDFVNAVTGDSLHIKGINSSNGGLSWSSPTRIGPGTHDQFFPWIAVNPSGNRISVMYYDRSSYANNDSMDVKISTSIDSGKSYTDPVRVNSVSLYPAYPQFMGDYNCLAASLNPKTPGKFFPIWADSRNADDSHIRDWDIYTSPANVQLRIRDTIKYNSTLNGLALVEGSVVIPSGTRLGIAPGSVLRVDDGFQISVNGKLIASGTPTDRITFSSSSVTPIPGAWMGVACSGGGPDTLTYCDINYAETGLWLQNTAANSYLQNDTIRYSSSGGAGLTVSNTGTANRSLWMYKCGINTNDGIGLKVGNAKASISYSSIENNGLQSISEGVYVYNGARVFFDSSRIQNNNGSGIKISGTGSRALLTPDSAKTGYNTVYQHGVSELWLTSSGSAFLGGGYYPGNYGGYNNVYNTYNYNCRLINNGTSNLVSAKWTYWGTAGTRFCGPVDSSSWLGSPVNTPAVMQFHDPGDEPMAVIGSGTALYDWLNQLKSDVTNNSENAFDALHHLANFSGPGGGYQSVLGMSWENFLSTVITNSSLPSVRSLATALLVQTSLDKGDFVHAITSADDLLAKKVDGDLQFFLQTRKIYAEVGRGNISSAKDVLSDIQATASLSDTEAVKAMTEYVLLAEKSAQDNSAPGSFVKNSIAQVQTPNTYRLSQNFPNPFNPTTSFRYQIAIAGHVSLKIYDVLGREVALIVDEQKDAGEYNVAWDASSYSSGVYFFKLQAGNFSDVKKMLLVR